MRFVATMLTLKLHEILLYALVMFGDIERCIRPVKKRVRAIYNTFPFQHILLDNVVEMARLVVFWLHSFSAKRGIGYDLSPHTIIIALVLCFHRHFNY